MKRSSAALFLLVSLLPACDADESAQFAVAVEPLCVELSPGESQAFAARIFVDQVDQGIDNQAVTWSVIGGNLNGTISNDPGDAGVYLAPAGTPAEDSVLIEARSKDDSQKAGQASVLFSGTCPQ